VLLICPEAYHTVQEPWRPRRLLVPLDGTERSEAALTPASEIAMRADAEIVLATVASWITAGALRRVLAGVGVSTAGVEETRTAGDYLLEVRSRALAGRRVREAVLRGQPAARLVELAQAEGIDLAVIVSRGRSGLGRFARGSVADRLLSAGLPVYFVPARPPAAS
jgi:nucleotide-binding universal stress UspA family protein